MSLELRGVRKAFGPVVAVDRIDLVLEPGTFVGLIGHNGAGKSTTLKMITGMLRPTEGEIRIGGIDVFADPLEARKRFGAVPENPALYEYMTAREFLQFIAEVRGASGIDDALALTGLGADADRLIREYSQGMRRKTALAAATLGDPGVLVLDEALNGLDPPSAASVKAALRAKVDAGALVVLSTHVVETVQAVADRVVMLAHGRVVADEQTADMKPGELEHLFLERLEASRDAREHA
ncbi:MAG: ABC transporter ATP-binding protein [Alphaproteobacteria bacterium]|nr:ABC transporter ATP-binding protein [Alphaproteobacteria bacterium]